MADKIYLGKRAASFNSAPRLPQYDMVVLNLDDDNYISSPYVTVDDSYWSNLANGEHVFAYDGSNWIYNGASVSLASYGLTVTYSAATAVKDGDTITVSKVDVNGEITVTATMTRSGSVLETNCPLVAASVRQSVADDLLAKVIGFSYQPFSAGEALLNPAAELGDAITAFGIYGGLYNQELNFSRLMESDIGAPASDEAEDETPYVSVTERKYTRKFAETAAEFSILASEISARVTKTGGSSSSFGWTLTDTSWTIDSSGSTVLSVDSSGLNVTGTITATAGTIGGCSIVNGVLSIASANISSINADIITAGTLSVDRIASKSLTGGKMANNTISTTQTSGGINTSLGYADFANGVFGGWNTASSVGCTSLIVNGSQYTRTTISFVDYYGHTRTWYVLATS